MMVTFVSQCEKNALKKTRRVLDAFANRIGDNTWQTLITEDGLLTVKKMLRQTASKSTAVSCFWIRSRSRSQFLWVVGNKAKFNSEGIVPVNTTSKEVPMDISRDKPIKGCVYANTQLQRLEQHLFAVGFVARELFIYFYPDKKAQANATFVAGCLHDIGKIDPSFQEWVIKDKSKSYIPEDGQHIDGLTKFSFEKHPRHNEISVLLYQLLDDKSLKALNGPNKNAVKHAVYWHHAKPFRPKGGFETLSDIYEKINSVSKGDAWNLIVLKSVEILNKVSEIDKQYNQTSESFLSKCYLNDPDVDGLDYINSNLPEYKTYKPKEQLSDYCADVATNANNNAIRSCLITADRWISSLSAHELASAIKHKTLMAFISEKLETSQIITESNLVSHITECLKSFEDSERTRKQADVANKLVDDIKDVGVLAGAAGCGKTKIALEWAKLKNAQQIIWICPRVQICQGIFTELTNKPYLPDATIELHTGEFKCTNSYENITNEKEYFTGDVVITTIDQMLSSVISHTKADRLLNYLSAHIIFDEYHEYINMPAFNLLFAELITAKKELKGGGNTLLVSATPHYYYLEKTLDLHKDDVIEMPAFNQSRYQFDFLPYDENADDDSNPLYKSQQATTFVISNTAITAQKSFIKNQHDENAILLHSKYKKSDKQQLFESVFESFKREGDNRFDLLRSGPIVQASLNISCDYMISEITHAENCLQRLGRLDRFGENKTGINQYTIVIPETFHERKGSGAVERFLSSTNTLASAKAWYEFLYEATDQGNKIVTLPDVYAIYKQFYENSTAIKWIESDLLASMKKSSALIVAKVSEPQTISKPKKDSKQRAKIGKNSLRGDNRFVQMAVCDVNAPNAPKFIEEYAYTVPINETDNIDGLTMSCAAIEGYGDSSNSLLIHMMKKHHNIMGGIKAFKDFILLNDAKDPELPIYLSYTTNDLLAVGGESARHSAAIYYGVCEKQPIGSISIKQLKSQEG
ncbi:MULTISPECIES: CRISPR-associated endonuclease Cas3'' [Colwellia]|uniref:Type I-F CRISPR-associated helicase Cas3 n=1 Tax=Colwellia marinimaniae TaxID=1513592 RepID=A0ABQ0MQN6_9GAMM|nr:MULTISPECIES: CRISPR-associated endonuclease Cas3'' [Colwellia]GAW94644.1 type I-F CRISPR-associated helicase Cas3 [Colwellia marinimaniae]